MIPGLGEWCLTLALLAALGQAMPLLLRGRETQRWLAMTMPFALAQLLCISLALAALVFLRITDDFSVQSVYENSHTRLPLLYKIVGTWGNHEGSMLLWAWMLALTGAALGVTRARGAETSCSLAQAVQGALGVGVLLFILFTSSPFTRVFPVPEEGADLNPLLQDVGLAMHPTLLYAGYVGFSTVYSLSVAALLLNAMNDAWLRTAQGFTLAAWAFLTFGIGLGSWWAYRELGWGGFWFWDPVENASLLPWLAGLALLHANTAARRRGCLKHWVLLLSILAFAMSMIGTFLVRSGLIVSVHSFASDPTRGLFILVCVALSIGGALALFALRGGNIENESAATPFSREGMILIGNLFFITALATVLLGTFYPVAMDAMGAQPVSVGAPYFNRTFLPLMAIPILMAGAALFIPWREGRMALLRKQLQVPAMAALAGAFIALAAAENDIALSVAGFAMGGWLAAATLRYALQRKFSATTLGVSVAHLGAAVFVIGVTGAGLWQQHGEFLAQPGQRYEVGNYRFEYVSETEEQGGNYIAIRAEVRVRDAGGSMLGTLHPSFRAYPARRSATSESDLLALSWGDVYAVLGEPSKEGTVLRVYLNPLMHFLWGGCMLAGLGGLLALFCLRRN